LLCQVKTGR